MIQFQYFLVEVRQWRTYDWGRSSARIKIDYVANVLKIVTKVKPNYKSIYEYSEDVNDFDFLHMLLFACMHYLVKASCLPVKKFKKYKF